jgi:hypothetical protein
MQEEQVGRWWTHYLGASGQRNWGICLNVAATAAANLMKKCLGAQKTTSCAYLQITECKVRTKITGFQANAWVGAYYCSRTFTVLYTAMAGQFSLAGLLSRTVPLIHLWRPTGVVVVK